MHTGGSAEVFTRADNTSVRLRRCACYVGRAVVCGLFVCRNDMPQATLLSIPDVLREYYTYIASGLSKLMLLSWSCKFGGSD